MSWNAKELSVVFAGALLVALEMAVMGCRPVLTTEAILGSWRVMREAVGSKHSLDTTDCWLMTAGCSLLVSGCWLLDC